MAIGPDSDSNMPDENRVSLRAYLLRRCALSEASLASEITKDRCSFGSLRLVADRHFSEALKLLPIETQETIDNIGYENGLYLLLAHDWGYAEFKPFRISLTPSGRVFVDRIDATPRDPMEDVREQDRQRLRAEAEYEFRYGEFAPWHVKFVRWLIGMTILLGAIALLTFLGRCGAR